MSSRKSIFGALLLGLLVLGLDALAPSAQAADPINARVNQCLAAAPVAEVAPACIGAAAKACEALPGGGRRAAIEKCVDEERGAWDRLLASEYARALKVFAEQDAKAGAKRQIKAADRLRHAQIAWRSYRATECSFEFVTYEGSAMARIRADRCRLNLTARRVFELRRVRLQ